MHKWIDDFKLAFEYFMKKREKNRYFNAHTEHWMLMQWHNNWNVYAVWLVRKSQGVQTMNKRFRLEFGFWRAHNLVLEGERRRKNKKYIEMKFFFILWLILACANAIVHSLTSSYNVFLNWNQTQ